MAEPGLICGMWWSSSLTRDRANLLHYERDIQATRPPGKSPYENFNLYSPPWGGGCYYYCCYYCYHFVCFKWGSWGWESLTSFSQVTVRNQIWVQGPLHYTKNADKNVVSLEGAITVKDEECASGQCNLKEPAPWPWRTRVTELATSQSRALQTRRQKKTLPCVRNRLLFQRRKPVCMSALPLRGRQRHSCGRPWMLGDTVRSSGI